MLVEPGAIVGASPANFNWSPTGAQLLYVAPLDYDPAGQQVLWRYDAATGETMLLNPAEHPGAIDITSAQWSPQGDRLLLTGDDALWLLDLATGDLKSLAEGGSAKTARHVHTRRRRGSHTYRTTTCTWWVSPTAQVQRLTTDGGETVFNGALDWVYNEELATRAAQPALRLVA